MTHKQRFDTTLRTRAMIALVERFLTGDATREEVQVWARAQGNAYSKPAPFPGNGAADDLHTCLWNMDQRLRSGDFLVRDIDLADHVRAVREGRSTFAPQVIAWTRLSIAEIAQRTTIPATRTPIQGLGWFEEVRFASLSTNARFVALESIENGDPVPGVVRFHVHAFPVSSDAAARLLDDLCDTLAIDGGDLVTDAPMVMPIPPPRWDVVRMDDNGHRFVVATYSGYAKARARLADLEALSHKQTYWLEEPESAVLPSGQPRCRSEH
jgi:hypothetical protein